MGLRGSARKAAQSSQLHVRRPMINSAVSKLTVAPNLAIEFLAMFSRLEYALKVTTKFRMPRNGEAKANWEAFVTEVEPLFDHKANNSLSEAFNYLTGQPLKFLGTQDGVLDWYEFKVPSNSSDAEKVIRVIKQVRHNLFHGGKFAHDSHATKERDTQLLNYGLIILENMIQLIEEVKSAYEY